MSTEQVHIPMSVDIDDTPVMSLDLANHSPVPAITVCGELDSDTAPHLADLVERVAADRPEQVVIDLANVTFFCAAGLNVLLRANDIITGAGGRLLLRSSPQVQRILIITATDGLFGIVSHRRSNGQLAVPGGCDRPELNVNVICVPGGDAPTGGSEGRSTEETGR